MLGGKRGKGGEGRTEGCGVELMGSGDGEQQEETEMGNGGRGGVPQSEQEREGWTEGERER